MTNTEFLKALFGEDYLRVHVTDFTFDPSNIPKDQHLYAWAGGYFSNYRFSEESNQYFTISIFNPDTEGKARRRKVLFSHTPVIVLDDVKEKLSMVEVSKLPPPSWVLESSHGSEQWGYILDTPCTDRARVENLLDGLVANGLAPEGKDPGMKGVTRYVRLPEGVNNKAKKLVDGKPFKCRITVWNPFGKVSIEELAKPFLVNLDAPRRESRVDGAADVSGHPLLGMTDVVQIKEVRSDGRFDITCPWVDEHTGSEDTGTAIFTNADGSMGFKCHHGACQHRTGSHLLSLIEGKSPGFGAKFASWKSLRSFAEVASVSFMGVPPAPPISFMDTPPISFMDTPEISFADPVIPPAPPAPPDGLQYLLDALKRVNHSSAEARDLAGRVLNCVHELPEIDKQHYHNEVCDLMSWSKSTLKVIVKDLQKQWFGDAKKTHSMFDNLIYINEQNRMYDYSTQIFYTPEAFQNAFAHVDSEARKSALQDGMITKVDKLDFAPRQAKMFEENGITYGNTWCEKSLVKGEPGDVRKWLNHFDVLGWTSDRDHMLKWMAYTVRFPENKINHMLMLGSKEGCGKDLLLYPLLTAMGRNAHTISGEELLEGFNDYILGTKYLHINETDLADRREAKDVSNRLKPIATAPPDTLNINQKGIKKIKVRNIVNGTMTTNSHLPLQLNGVSRRFFCVWSDLSTRNERDETTAYWRDYFHDIWTWMKTGGAEACIWHLQHVVDLTDFNPSIAPPMTEFLREITESSKSVYQQSIERFFRMEIGAFKSDLVTARDVAETMRAGDLVSPQNMYCRADWFTPTKVGLVLKDISSFVRMRARSANKDVKLFCIRDAGKYANLSTADLCREYEEQILASKQLTGVRAVS